VRYAARCFGFWFALLVFFLFFSMPVWLFFFAGIRAFVLVLQALPLCGAAPTFLCSGKEK
jgi:hypothetical protein